MEFLLNKLKNFFLRKMLSFKYRHIDPEMCCCGNQIANDPYDSICQHGGCRSAKKYMISREMKITEPKQWRQEYIQGNGVDDEMWISPDGKCYYEPPKKSQNHP